MQKKKLLGVLLSSIIVLQSTVFGATGTVRTDILNVRENPNVTSAVIGQSKLDNKVAITDVCSDFYQIDFHGDYAYVSKDYVSVDVVCSGVVMTDSLNIRSGAGTEYNSLGTFNTGEIVSVTATVGSWYQILYNGDFAYLSSDYVSIRTADVEYASRGGYSRNAASLVEYSKDFIGVPYVSGGSSPSGFDCSGFTSYIYSQYGVTLPRTASGQAAVGVDVQRNALAPGDLVFFNTYGGISHVGIYVGGTSFIHATVPGDTVRISDLTSSYYSSRFVCARRILR